MNKPDNRDSGIRLSKVSRELNVGISTLVDFLRQRGIRISSNPYQKIEVEIYELLEKQFKKDNEARIEADRVNLRRSPDMNQKKAMTEQTSILPPKAKIFISYSDKDREKMRSLEKIIKKYESLKSIIIADNRQTLKGLDAKVITGISSCDYFIPILTKESIITQWINQEIGFAKALDKKIYPIVDKEIIDQLKGFIHKGVDLPYSYEPSSNKRSENLKF